jgi:hypothetical protein
MRLWAALLLLQLESFEVGTEVKKSQHDVREENVVRVLRVCCLKETYLPLKAHSESEIPAVHLEAPLLDS